MSQRPPEYIYVFTAPGYDRAWTRTVDGRTVDGHGVYKVGQTYRHHSVRVREQSRSIYPDREDVKTVFAASAQRDDGTYFTDTDVRDVLVAHGIHKQSEVVEATLDEIKAAIAAVRARRGYDPYRTEEFPPRQEQRDAIDRTAAYFEAHANDRLPVRYLWNAKMRFGKTFAAYQLAQRMGWRRMLVVTFQPVARSAWRADLLRHVDFADWVYADREEPCDLGTKSPVVWFVSLQDMLGKTDDGDFKRRNLDILEARWDCVVLDEYHFGAWKGAAKELCSAPTSKIPRMDGVEEREARLLEEARDLTDSGNPRLVAAVPDAGIEDDIHAGDLATFKTRQFLYLSGTPFRALTEGEFNEDAIFNWTYSDEQRRKRDWATNPEVEGLPNPYRELPEMRLFTYRLSDVTTTDLDQREDGLFDLAEFFAAEKVGSEYGFKNREGVREFLNMLTGKLDLLVAGKLLGGTQPMFPYSHPEFAKAVEHSVWVLPSIASAHAMKAELEAHPFFRDVVVHVAAGPKAKSADRAKALVDQVIDRATTLGKQTITLTVTKLLTGVTMAQWGAIFMLRPLQAPESYFQAAFRVQSPWYRWSSDGTKEVLKNACYVFDFDPNRALSLIYQYGTKLASSSVKTPPSSMIDELIEFLPIVALDGGEWKDIDVKDVMDWATAGASASMLTLRWQSAKHVNLSDEVLRKLLTETSLLESLEEMEDFRALRQTTRKILALSDKARKQRSRSGSGSDPEPEDPEVKEARRAKNKQIKALRDKLIKFIQAIPVFMYLTDFREEALVDVIESLDTQLFERVTGLTIEDFHKLAETGVFNAAVMEESIYRFRSFERLSLRYLGTSNLGEDDRPIGLWDSVSQPSSAGAD